jgi:hypothetical protein
LPICHNADWIAIKSIHNQRLNFLINLSLWAKRVENSVKLKPELL